MVEQIRAKGWVLILLAALGLMSMTAMVIATLASFAVSHESNERENDRITSDLAACDRGNEFRANVKTLGQASSDLVAGVVVEIGEFASLDPAEVTALDARLQPLFDEHAAIVEQFTQVNCQAVTVGSNERNGE